MSRWVPIVLVALPLAGCSLGTFSLGSGFADGADKSAVAQSSGSRSASRSQGAQSDLGADKSPASQPSGDRVAMRADAPATNRVPNDSHEKAPPGALSDRDYSKVTLDAESARDAINRYRRSRGLKPLTLSVELTQAAKTHSRDLAKWDRISHYGSDGSNPLDRVKRTGYRAKLAAENVGTGQLTFDEVMQGWKASPGHDKNLLLADARHIGIALVHEPRTEFKTFWTLVLGAQN